jgi:hypothetical protein
VQAALYALRAGMVDLNDMAIVEDT